MLKVIEQLANLNNLDGLTLKGYKAITYKTGWQVADTGVQCYTLQEAVMAIAKYKGSCGVWLENGIYYVDHSFRVKTKKEALAIGRAHNQISVLKWANMSLVYC
jgi:hypothetical protein